MLGFGLYLAAALLPLVGTGGADQEKGQQGQRAAQSVPNQIPPSSRMLNVALSDYVCKGKGKNVCGATRELGAPTGNPNAKWFCIFYTYPDGACDRFEGKKGEVDEWKKKNCSSDLGCFECIFG